MRSFALGRTAGSVSAVEKIRRRSGCQSRSCAGTVLGRKADPTIQATAGREISFAPVVSPLSEQRSEERGTHSFETSVAKSSIFEPVALGCEHEATDGEESE